MEKKKAETKSTSPIEVITFFLIIWVVNWKGNGRKDEREVKLCLSSLKYPFLSEQDELSNDRKC